MARRDPQDHEQNLKRPDAMVMDFTGRPMRGCDVDALDGIVEDGGQDLWIGLALNVEPRAKSSKKKRVNS